MTSTPTTTRASLNRITVIPGDRLTVATDGHAETHPWTEQTATDVLAAILDMATAREVLIAAHGVASIADLPELLRPELVTIDLHDGHLPDEVAPRITRLFQRAHLLAFAFEGV
ncbi:hypothetical protein C5E06_09950 [Pseudoclavibacter sp. RFBI5]|uniref:hypothetical protein n=1 Tax=Pseudoclavibacter sp. RFBI5 TaxID=2080578 RepID=UPI000CE8EFBE|nr:hypothetical protein [Pseudoclavibacter sp. RFBI5]PPG02763.1 hypothetical protein C5E06_09950 [Pseudoclavibacter sp. RFBI5]